MQKEKKTAKRFFIIVSVASGAVFAVFLCITLLIAAAFPVRYSNIINAEAARFNVDTRLVYAVIWTESKFDSSAVSHAGAVGLMQLLPSTAKWCAEKLGEDFSEERLFDPAFNIRLGVFYLSYLINKHGVETAIAAYNAGEGNIKKWAGEIRYRETRDYIRRVRMARFVYRFRLY